MKKNKIKMKKKQKILSSDLIEIISYRVLIVGQAKIHETITAASLNFVERGWHKVRCNYLKVHSLRENAQRARSCVPRLKRRIKFYSNVRRTFSAIATASYRRVMRYRGIIINIKIVKQYLDW